MGRIVLLGLLVLNAAAAKSALPFDNAEACMQGPLAQFGRYVGNWQIADLQLSQDGTEWQPGNGARWDFVCVGDGTAVQDFWLPADGTVGTNLRTYNPDSGAWEIVWAALGQKGLMHIAAQQDDDGNIVMDILRPEQDPPRRIIFYTPDENGWSWAQQWSLDDRKTWFDVYRIRATPFESE